MLQLHHDTKKFYLFVLITTTISGILFILPDFIFYPTVGFKGAVYTALHWALNCIPLLLIFYIISLNRYVYLISFPIFILTGTTIAYYSYFYKATLTPMIIDATLNNDLRTSLDVITPYQAIITTIIFFISVFIARYRYKNIHISKTTYHLAVAVTILIVIFTINDRVSTSFYQRYPISLFYNLNEYRKLNAYKNTTRINPDPTLKYKANEELIVVFVIGESVRADHLAINGYKRNTTPLLTKQKNLVSFKNIYSEYTYTNPSVAHILTRADSINPELSKTEKSFITLFKNSNYRCTWIANQDASTSYYSFMKEADSLIFVRPEKSVYTYSNWLDSDIIPHYISTLNQPHNNKLIILHTIGSHWFYNSHYPSSYKKFNPIAKSKIVSQNTPEEIINSYDNSILFSDKILNEIIENLKNKNAILIYLSDHGESLGENGNWLHASDDKYLKNPACFVWYSDTYNNNNTLKIKSLYNNKNRRYRTDFLFHSILAASSIPSKTIKNKLNIFNYE